jgi:NAD dependent epimerase/dehydratase family enzyme
VLGRELAEDLLYSSQRVVPEQLEASGFEFAYPELEDALRHVLGKPVAA